MSEPNRPARRFGMLAIALLTLAVVLAVLVLPPVPQPEQYHNFADQRAFLGIPHFLNVISNVAFLLVGGTGLRRLLRDGTALKSTVLACKDFGKIGLPEAMGISPWVIVPICWVGIIALFFWFEKKKL